MPRFLVTGGAGFIGANLVRELAGRGEEVHAVIRHTSSLWRLNGLENKIRLHTLDIANGPAVRSLMAEVQPDTVFHCAAEATNPAAVPEKEKIIASNSAATANLADAAAQTGCVFINTGSSSEYGPKNIPMREEDALEPTGIYGETKAAGTLYVQALAAGKNLPMVTLRLFSPFGYWDSSHRLIPALIASFLEKKTVSLYSPNARRDFVFIEDVVRAYFHFASEAPRLRGEIFNIGSGQSHSVAETVKAIEDLTGEPLRTEYTAAAKQAEPQEWVADTAKAEAAGWRATTDFKEGLRKTIEWHKSFLKNDPA